jgi:hypothetical protein
MKLLATTSLAALLAFGIATSAGTAAGGTTFTLTERDTSFHFLPVAGPRKGRIAKPGDEMVFAGKVLDAQKRPTGRIEVGCVVTLGGANPTLQCTGTYTLTGGTLVGSGVIRGNSKAATRIAILGGTGVYEGARGSILSTPSRTNDNVSSDTVHLLP